jgi:hypothetical protein
VGNHGDIVAGEVHQADAANLPVNECDARRRRERCDAQPILSGRLMKTAGERAEEKLESVAQQVENGELVIRPMTERERRNYPPLRRQSKRPERG